MIKNSSFHYFWLHSITFHISAIHLCNNKLKTCDICIYYEYYDIPSSLIFQTTFTFVSLPIKSRRRENWISSGGKLENDVIIMLAKRNVSLKLKWFKGCSSQSNYYVSAIPKSKPVIISERARYEPGETLRANCSIPSSKPPARLSFSLNDVQVSTNIHLQGFFFNYKNFRNFRDANKCFDMEVNQIIVIYKNYVKKNWKNVVLQ